MRRCSQVLFGLLASSGLCSCTDDTREPGSTPLVGAPAQSSSEMTPPAATGELPSPVPVATPDRTEGNPDPSGPLGSAGGGALPATGGGAGDAGSEPPS